MTNINQIKTNIEQHVGSVTVKNLFCGYGIFKKKQIFAIYLNDVLYLRAKNTLAKFFVEQGGASILNGINPYYLSLGDYYRLPRKITQNEKYFSLVLQLSIKQALYMQQQKELRKKNRIKELANLSIKHERLLRKINVLNVEEFQQLGAVESFINLKKAGVNVNMNTFWAFVGALHHCHVYVLPQDICLEALLELNEALVKANFKPVKSLLLDDYNSGKIKRSFFPNLYKE